MTGTFLLSMTDMAEGDKVLQRIVTSPRQAHAVMNMKVPALYLVISWPIANCATVIISPFYRFLPVLPVWWVTGIGYAVTIPSGKDGLLGLLALNICVS